MTYEYREADWVGKPVFDSSGKEIGKVRGVHPSKHFSFITIETKKGHGTALPLKYGIHGEYDVHYSAGLHVPYSVDEIDTAPSFKGSFELTTELEKSITGHFKIYSSDLPGNPEVPYDPPSDE